MYAERLGIVGRKAVKHVGTVPRSDDNGAPGPPCELGQSEFQRGCAVMRAEARTEAQIHYGWPAHFSCPVEDELRAEKDACVADASVFGQCADNYQICVGGYSWISRVASCS